MGGPNSGGSIGEARGEVHSDTGTLASLRGSRPVSFSSRPRILGSSTRLSRDGHRTWVAVELTGRAPAFASMTFGGLSPGLYTAIRNQVRSKTLEVFATGPAGPVTVPRTPTGTPVTDVART
mgnify:CR=1 FL=1